jgi:hypothetical protein
LRPHKPICVAARSFRSADLGNAAAEAPMSRGSPRCVIWSSGK